MSTEAGQGHLEKAILVGANLMKAYLRVANLEKANLVEARYDSETTWPEGFDLEAAGASKFK